MAGRHNGDAHAAFLKSEQPPKVANGSESAESRGEYLALALTEASQLEKQFLEGWSGVLRDVVS
jgi:hypothetical protein